jgi:hypothetical protein
MSTTRLASLLSFAAASLVCGTLAGCIGSPDRSSKADAAPDDDGCGGPMEDAGHTGEGSNNLGEAGSTCPPVAADDSMGTACLADMVATCGTPLAACNADCACASLVTGCLDSAFDLGVVECLSATQDTVTGALFDCIYFSAPCNVAKDTSSDADGGSGD